MAPKKETKPEKITKKMYKVRYDSLIQGKVFLDPGVRHEMRPDGSRMEVKTLEKPFEIVAGQEKIIDEATYSLLRKKGQLLTLEEKEELDKFKIDKTKIKSGRAEPKLDAQILSDVDKMKAFVEYPYIIEEIEAKEE